MVQYAAWRVNKYPFRGYILLGDDIVIAGSEVGQSYKKVIGELGVSISESKTHVSNITFEFAKKWYLRENQFTPFPINRALESQGHYVELVETIRDACRKELIPTHQGINCLGDPGFVTSLFEAFGKPRAFAQRLT